MKMLAFSCLLVLCGPANAQTLAVKADELLTAYTAQHKFSGAVLIAKKDSVVFHKAYGYADLSQQRANTTNTTFRAGSLTKMFTSALIAQLAAEKKLSVADPVSKYVPDASWVKGITLKQLLSHTSGIKGSTPPGSLTPAEMVTGFRAVTPAFVPGEKFEYNNFNYILLSYIAEKITGTAYPALVKTAVLDKAGMSRSGIDSATRIDTNKAIGYRINPATNEWVVTGEGESVKAASGAGALYTTTHDLYKWAAAIHNASVWPGASYRQATTPVQEGYGLGWIVRRRDGHLQVGHTGAIEGFIATMLLFPEDSTTVIYLSNLQDLNTAEFEKNLFALALGEPYQLPVMKQEITLPEAALQEYTGIYEQSKQAQMKVLLETGKLVMIAPGGDKLELSAASADHFFLKGPDIEVTFNRAAGKIISLFVKMGSGQTFEKVN